MTNEQAKSELMQIYMSLSEEKKQALDVLMAQNCDQCEVGNPCLYCEYEFKAKSDRNEFYNWDAPIRHKADGEYISRKALLEDLYKRDYTKFTHRDFVALVQYQDIVAIPPDHDGCKDCKYVNRSTTEEPCVVCKQNYKDEWQKKPHWNHGVCDNCGYDWGKDAPIASVPNFCPKCGARMVEPQKERIRNERIYHESRIT